MDVLADWWSALDRATQQYLIDHNGEPLPSDIASAVVRAGAPANDQSWWGERTADGSALSDELIDRIEEFANDE
jgi:hypothetical protein